MRRRRKKHRHAEMVDKLRDVDAMHNASKDLAAVLQAIGQGLNSSRARSLA